LQIESFYISRYRSLIDFKIDKFDSTTIFYGDNNVGKSNILNALHTIFKRKRERSQEPGKLILPGNFYTGVIENFSNNFYNNEPENINFVVELSIDNSELSIHDRVISILKKGKLKNKSYVRFDGVISHSTMGKEYAEIFLRKVYFNGIEIYRGDNIITYFPTIDKLKKHQGEFANIFSKLIEPFNDCVTIIESSRDMLPAQFVSDESIDTITPYNFKHFLHKLYLSEEGHKIFEEIDRVFSSDPFKFGSISFSNPKGNLEIMIKNENIRLPIKHIGSGILQSLYVISRAVHTQSKIICIEELEQNLSPLNQFKLIAKLQSMIKSVQNHHIDQIVISSHSTVYAKPKLGLIYYLEKNNNATIVQEIVEKQLKAGMKKHLIFAALPQRTYTDAEQNINDEVAKRLNEEGFKR
jgi:AAA15 family ATPase/GTPase